MPEKAVGHIFLGNNAIENEDKNVECYWVLYDIGETKISIFYYYNTYIMSVKAEMRPRTKSNFQYSSDLSFSIESTQQYEVVNSVNNLLQFHVNLNLNTESSYQLLIIFFSFRIESLFLIKSCIAMLASSTEECHPSWIVFPKWISASFFKDTLLPPGE